VLNAKAAFARLPRALTKLLRIVGAARLTSDVNGVTMVARARSGTASDSQGQREEVSMPAYVMARIEVTDPERYREYAKATPGVLAKYGGRFLVRGGRVVTLEGPEEAARIAILEFASAKQAEAWYHSQDYQQAKRLRDGAAVVSLAVIEGYEG